VAGEVPITSTDLTAAHENIKAGNLVALGVTSTKRSRLAPDIPTIAEGVHEYVGPSSFIGMMAPLGTPPARIRQLSSAIAAILERPEVQERVRTLSVEPDYEDEATFGKYLAAESAKLKDVIKSLPPP
jgi:tripartite-type tricarboxylate transporter receptor subunit TctC